MCREQENGNQVMANPLACELHIIDSEWFKDGTSVSLS